MSSSRGLSRWWRHLRVDRGELRRCFPDALLREIEVRVGAAEAGHGAELRVAIEPSLGLADVWRRRTPRERALEVFGSLRVWDTEGNNGVLLYVLLADRAVEIVADRAAARAIGDHRWDEVARALADAYRSGDWAGGTLAAIDRINALLAEAFPAAGRNPDELPNRPVML